MSSGKPTPKDAELLIRLYEIERAFCYPCESVKSVMILFDCARAGVLLFLSRGTGSSLPS